MSTQSSSLELYVGAKDGDNHSLILVEGFSRTERAKTPDIDVLYNVALSMMENDEVQPSLRMFDANRRIVRCGDIRVSQERLRQWNSARQTA